jgi:hypothetical protein
MKTPMTSEEWFNKFGKDGESIFNNMEEYSTYLLKHHLEQFAKECKRNTRVKDISNYLTKGEKRYIVDISSIDQTLTDYLTKNNIK